MSPWRIECDPSRRDEFAAWEWEGDRYPSREEAEEGRDDLAHTITDGLDVADVLNATWVEEEE